MAIRTRYRAATIPAPHQRVEFREFPAPQLEEGAALLHTICSEVCGTDVHLHQGKLAGVPYPLIPGHVAAGTLAEIRGRITDIDGQPFREGDVVTYLDVYGTCNACYQCLVARQTTRCPHRRVYGITFGANDGLLGGWSEAIWIKPGLKLVRLPQNVAAEAFMGGGCGLVTALHALDRAEIKLGQSVAILGVGPVGQSVIAFAALSGGGEIFAVGGPDSRLAFAKRMGATTTVSLSIPRADRIALIRNSTHGRGVDVVIEASGNAEAVSDALEMVRDGGRVVIVGHYTDNGPVLVHPHHQINKKHVEIRGCWGSDFSHFYRAVDAVSRFGDRIPWAEMVSERYSLDRAPEALQAVADQTTLKAMIVPNG